MHTVRFLIPLIALLFTSACAALTITPDKSNNAEAPALLQRLPDTIESFKLQGFKYFNEGSGYSIRYSNSRKQRLADLYIYEVADENASLDHKQLVLGSTRATMDAIGAAAKQGHYANFNVLDTATHIQGMRTVARVQATYLRQNLASYTLVYQTEYKGTLLKIRVTMPDNDTNRNSSEWDSFTDTVFQVIISELDSTDMQHADADVDTLSEL